MTWIAELHGRLRQADVWIDARGRGVRVESMDRRHAANAIAFLERHAEALLGVELWALARLPLPYGDAAGDAADDEMQRLYEADARGWLDDQPLMIALRERAGDHPGGPSLWWRMRLSWLARALMRASGTQGLDEPSDG